MTTTNHPKPPKTTTNHAKPVRSLPTSGRSLPASVIEAQALDKVIGVVQILREISPSMTLNQALVFLEIARRDGVEALTIRKQTELPHQTLSHVIAALSPTSYHKKEGRNVNGYDLIVQSDNFDDGRAKNLHLTQKGKKISEKIISKINN